MLSSHRFYVISTPYLILLPYEERIRFNQCQKTSPSHRFASVVILARVLIIPLQKKVTKTSRVFQNVLELKT